MPAVCSVRQRLCRSPAPGRRRGGTQGWAGACRRGGGTGGSAGRAQVRAAALDRSGARDAEGRHPGGGRVAETQEDAGGGAHEAEAMGRGANAQGLTGEGERSRGGAGRCRRSRRRGKTGPALSAVLQERHTRGDGCAWARGAAVGKKI
jgi:hypothetical protein